jgi:hypothetical protein
LKTLSSVGAAFTSRRYRSRRCGAVSRIRSLFHRLPAALGDAAAETVRTFTAAHQETAMNTLPPRPGRRAVLALGLAFTAALGLALPPQTARAQDFGAAFQQFQRASGGDKNAVDGAAARFAQLSAAAPQDPVLRAYAGAATSLRATTTMLPWRKLSFAEDGLAQIDKALAQLAPAHDAPAHRGVPASLETRFVAASTFLRMPSMFNRQDRGAKLLDELLAQPLLAQSPLPFRATVWMRAADEARRHQRLDAARTLLQQVADSGAPQAASAQAMLKEMPSKVSQ